MEKNNEFGQFLIAKGYIDPMGLARGLEVALQSGEPIGEVLERIGVLSKVELAEAVLNIWVSRKFR